MARVLIYTDRHKREKDFESISGYVNANRQVDRDLEKFVEEQKITHLISAGDLYDRGYRKTGPTYNDTMTDRNLTDMVNGNHYLVIGNHLYHERDANPEFSLLQPNPNFPTVHRIDLKEPVLRVESELVIGPVQFSFFHFDKISKDYINERKDGIKFHVGIYHDDAVVPNSVRSKLNMFSKEVSSTYLQDIYSNVDMAVVGHIHSKIGAVTLPVNGKNVPVLIPGALALTSTNVAELHDTVDLPVFDINEETGEFAIEMHSFSVHRELLSFHKKPEVVIPEPIRVATEGKTPIGFTASMRGLPTLEEALIEDGLDQRAIELIDKAIRNELDCMTALKIIVPLSKEGSTQ